MLERGRRFQRDMDGRRSVRMFAADPVPRELIELAIMTGSTAPSGAHQQPWTFVAVSDPEMKRQIRIAAEEEARQSYEGGRMPAEWLAASRPSAPTGTSRFSRPLPGSWCSSSKSTVRSPDGSSRKHYYARESVGIACGLFVAAVHQMGW